MSGAGLIELLAARLGGRGVRRASPSLREALVDLSARSAEPGVAGQEEALRQAYGRLSMEMPTENLRLPTSRVSLDDLPDVGPGWRDKDKVAHYADLLAQSEPPPIMIARDARNGAWDVIDGNHRLEVMRAAGRREIPAMDATGAFKGRYVSSDAMPPKAAPRRTGPDAGGGQGGSNATGYLSPREIAARDVLRRSPDISNEELSAALGMDDPLAAGIIRARVEKKTGMQAASAERVRLIDMVRNQNARLQRGQTAEVSRMSWDENTPMTMYQFPGEALTNVRITQRPDGVREVVFSARGLKQGAASRADIEGVFGDALSAMERDAITNPGGRYFFEGESPAITRLHALLLRNANMPDGVSARSVGDGIEVTFGRTQPDGGPAQAGRDADGVRVYHGTTRDFADFSTGNVSNGATQDAPMALFFAENPETARIYSRSSAVDARSSSARFRDVANGVAPDQRQQLLELAARKERHEALISQARERLNAIDEANGGFASPITPERRAAQRELQQLLDSPPITNAEVRAAMRPRVVEARLNMRNPRRVDMRNQDWSEDLYASEIEAARRAGNDGVIFEGVREPGAPADNVYAVFDTSRISRSGPNAGSDRNALQRALRERMERE